MLKSYRLFVLKGRQSVRKGTMKEASQFIHVLTASEKEGFANGIGILDASGVEAGGRISELTETKDEVAVSFAYYAIRSEGKLSLRTQEKPAFSKKTLVLHRVQVECLVLEESPDSCLILLPNPKDIARKVRDKTKA